MRPRMDTDEEICGRLPWRREFEELVPVHPEILSQRPGQPPR